MLRGSGCRALCLGLLCLVRIAGARADLQPGIAGWRIEGPESVHERQIVIHDAYGGNGSR